MANLSLLQSAISILSGIVVALLGGYIAEVRDNQRWLKDEVYRQLYDEMATSSEGDLPEGEGNQFESKWSEFDYYQRYRVGEELRTLLDDFSEMLQKANSLQRDRQFSPELAEKLPDETVSVSQADIYLHGMRSDDKDGGGRITLDNWLDSFSGVILRSNDPEEMREGLITLSEKEGWGHEKNLRGWDEHVPGWETVFFEAFRQSEAGLIRDVEQYEQLTEEKIPAQATAIKTELEKKINRNFIQVILNRIASRIPI